MLTLIWLILINVLISAVQFIYILNLDVGHSCSVRFAQKLWLPNSPWAC